MKTTCLWIVLVSLFLSSCGPMSGGSSVKRSTTTSSSANTLLAPLSSQYAYYVCGTYTLYSISIQTMSGPSVRNSSGVIYFLNYTNTALQTSVPQYANQGNICVYGSTAPATIAGTTLWSFSVEAVSAMGTTTTGSSTCSSPYISTGQCYMTCLSTGTVCGSNGSNYLSACHAACAGVPCYYTGSCY